jgi:hypothetical protein
LLAGRTRFLKARITSAGSRPPAQVAVIEREDSEHPDAGVEEGPMETKRRTRLAWSAAVLGVAAFAGCATTQVKTDWDKQANFSQYRTFAIQAGKVVPAPGSVEAADQQPDTLVLSRIDTALQNDLVSKGLRPVQQNPDMIVTYTAGARNKQEVVSNWDGFGWGFGPGWGYGPYYNDVWVDQYPQATLVIDLIDANTKKVVFRAVAKADDKNIRNPKFIQSAVDKALAKYPALAGA